MQTEQVETKSSIKLKHGALYCSCSDACKCSSNYCMLHKYWLQTKNVGVFFTVNKQRLGWDSVCFHTKKVHHKSVINCFIYSWLIKIYEVRISKVLVVVLYQWVNVFFSRNTNEWQAIEIKSSINLNITVSIKQLRVSMFLELQLYVILFIVQKSLYVQQ